MPALLKDWGQQEFAKLPGRLVTAVQILTIEQTTVWHTARMPDEHSLESDVETSIIQSGFAFACERPSVSRRCRRRSTLRCAPSHGRSGAEARDVPISSTICRHPALSAYRK